MYGMKNFTSINEARLELFLRKYKPKRDNVISCLKKIDESFLPPCSRVVKEKVRRTNFIAGKWLYSSSEAVPLMKPENSGWVLDNQGTYRLKWFDGEVAPGSLEIILTQDDVDNDENANDEREYNSNY